VRPTVGRGLHAGTLSVTDDIERLSLFGFSDRKSVDAPFDRGSRVDDIPDGSYRDGPVLNKLHRLSSKFELCELEVRSRDATSGVKALP
jgi:hypothetical protein